jgi:hypothetical protein
MIWILPTLCIDSLRERLNAPSFPIASRAL